MILPRALDVVEGPEGRRGRRRPDPDPTEARSFFDNWILRVMIDQAKAIA